MHVELGFGGVERLPLATRDGGLTGRRGTADNAVLGMAIFLATEVMVFGALISAFLILRAGSSTWPPVGQPRLPLIATGINTLVLLFSAYTMQRAVSDLPSSTKRTSQWLRLTALLGSLFLVVQGVEWVRLIGYGLNASSGVYGATFYTLIGCHALHVLAAVLVVGSVALRTPRALAEPQWRGRLHAYRMYWLFVVGVWPLLYVLVYLA